MSCEETWKRLDKYFVEKLDEFGATHLNTLCLGGSSFNTLTKYSDTERMEQRPDLFFGDSLYFFDYCKRNFSRIIALLHDHGLYDFTILVRKDN